LETHEEEQGPLHDSTKDNEELIDEREVGKDIHAKSYKEHEVEHEFPYESVKKEHFDEAHHLENPIQEEDPHEDKTLVFVPPFDEDEVTQAYVSPSHEYKNEVSCTLLQVFDSYDASFHNLENEEFLEEPFDVVDFSSNKEHNDCIDDFICIRGHRWHKNCFHFDGDLIYDGNNGSRIKIAILSPLEYAYMSIVDLSSW
jgi:hypothetical protein